jgi:TPR repeat protein
MYGSGRGVAADPAAAWQWRLRAAQLGDAGAQFVVGMRYLNGPGVVRDPNEAAFWLEQAARQNHPHAAFELGLLLLAGDGVTPNPERGLDWLRAAADLGLLDAQEALAEIYGQGRAGVRKDAAASARWEAAARQNAQAGQQMNESIMQQQNAIAIARNTYYYRPAYTYPWGYPAWGVGWGRYGGWNYGVGVGGVWW